MFSSPSAERIAPLIAAMEALGRVQRETAARIARDLGCAPMSLSLLRALREQPRQLTEIATLLRVDLSVASRHATHLVDAGLAERAVDPSDRRARTITLTNAGRDLLRRSSVYLAQRAAQTFTDWTDDDLASACHLLGRLADTVGTTTPPSRKVAP